MIECERIDISDGIDISKTYNVCFVIIGIF